MRNPGITVTCTDRGQHTRTILTVCRIENGQMVTTEIDHDTTIPPDPAEGPGEGASHDSYRFQCPRCGRGPIIRRVRWIEIVSRAERVGLGEVDISVLPF